MFRVPIDPEVDTELDVICKVLESSTICSGQDTSAITDLGAAIRLNLLRRQQKLTNKSIKGMDDLYDRT